MRRALRWFFALFFILAGINHFVHPAFLVAIVPPYLPDPLLLVRISGAVEMGLGALLLFERWRRIAGGGIILLLIAIFPANLHMAMHPELFPQFSKTMLLIRLPIQGALIAWACVYARARG